MYKIIISIVVVFLGGLTQATAQNNNPRFEQIKAHKVAYLTDRMNLTVEEAKKFWPLYNDYEAALKEIREDTKMTVRDPNEEESRKILDSMIEKGERETALKREFYDKASEVVSYRKLYLMVVAEREFRVKLLERYKNLNKRK